MLAKISLFFELSNNAFSYAFTSKYGIPHGQAIWLTLPKIFGIHFNAYQQPNGIHFNAYQQPANSLLC